MLRYTAKRIVMIIPIVLGVTLIVFVLLYSLPGSTLDRIPINRGGDALDSLFEFFGATPNLITRYARYCYNVIVYRDFGHTGMTRFIVMMQFDYRVRNTILLLLTGLGAALAAGIPLGAIAAVRKDRAADRIINSVTLLFSSIPNYALALVLVLIIAVQLRLMPVLISYTSPKAFIMPTLTISLGGIASIARMTRTAMLEVFDQPYITALRSKGMKQSDVFRHALKNAMVPIISVLGGLIAQLLCGTLAVEYFFNVPGIGSFMLGSVSSRDHYTLLTCAMILTIILSITNTLADLLYAVVNPQIKMQYAKKSKKLYSQEVME